MNFAPINRIARTIGDTTDYVFSPVQDWFDGHQDSRWWLSVLRLGLFQFGVGLSLAPITGTLNRVLITDLGIPAVVVALLISLHYFVSPVRAMIGYKSDQARSAGRWRTPYIVFGVVLTYGGLACAPFALILLGGDGVVPFLPAMLICLLIFGAYGLGINIIETVYLALVSDITAPRQRGKVIALLWIMLILGTVVSAIIVSALLTDYSHRRLIQVMQGSAIVFVLLTVIALYRQERLRPDGSIISRTATVRVRLSLLDSLKQIGAHQRVRGLFLIIFISMMAFAVHDVLLEPYGGQVLGMSVSQTMELTALWGIMTITGVATAGWMLVRKQTPIILISLGCGFGLVGFGVVTASSTDQLVDTFRFGVGLISMGRGLFLVGSIILVMSLADIAHAGLFMGVWGIVQAMGQGFGTIGGGLMRDVVQHLTGSVATGYTAVYTTSLALLAIVLLLIVFRLGRRLQVSEIRMPWQSLDDIPADQLAF
jgi:MFS transporter, BCD family, chlorophyll transporter